MADLVSKIRATNGVEYDIADSQARQDISDILKKIAGGVSWLGVTTTAISDNSTTNPIMIAGVSTTANKGDIVQYGADEFIWNGAAWQKFGPSGTFGKLAFVDTAYGTHTPSGSVSKPTVTPTKETITGMANSGTLPSFSAVVSDGGVLSFTMDPGTLPTKQTAIDVLTAVDVAAPTFTGDQATISVTVN